MPFSGFHVGLNPKTHSPLYRMGKNWILQALPQGYLHSLTICHGMVARDLEKWILPEERVFYHYLDDIMLTWSDLFSLYQAAALLQKYFKS